MRYPIPEPSMLELRGAIDLLRAAQRTIPTCGWRGAGYYTPTPAEKEAYTVLGISLTKLYPELRAMLGQSKEVTQAAALASIPLRSSPPAVSFCVSPWPRY